ncbi:MAG: S9 family peptidase [Sphaerochaetaceae bacterium]|nr:S9 family peptidase [Sphaerochaetaceae bacterium]
MKQTDTAIQLDDFLSNHILTNLETDENWTFACFSEDLPDRETDSYRKKLYLVDLQQNSCRELELSFEADGFVISGDCLLLKQLHDGKTTLYRYRLADASIEVLSVIPFIIEQFALFENYLFFTAETLGREFNDRVVSTVYSPVGEEGRAFNGDGVRGLFQATARGRDITLLTALDMDVNLIDFDSRLNRIVFTAYHRSRVKPIESSIYQYDISGKNLELLVNERFRVSSVTSFSPDEVLFTAADLVTGNRNDNHQLYRYRRASGNVEILGGKVDRSNESPSIVTDSYFSQSPIVRKTSEALYMKRIERDREMLYRVSCSGEITPVDTGLTLIGGFAVRERGEERDLLLIGLKDLQLSELYRLQDGALRQVSRSNDLFSRKELAVPQPITVTSEGCEVDGYVYPPTGWQQSQEETKSFPAVLMIHGGPKMLYAPVYAQDIQLLCSRGYFVMCANPKGSDGRGDAFADIRGDFAELPFRQLMEFVEAALAAYPQIDEKRLGVTGGSYGGYMTNYIITHTDRFRTAVSERGICNLMTSFAATDIGYQFIHEYMGNTAAPWSNPEKLCAESPLYQADRAVTPTLFIHGKDDSRCNAVESVQMFNALNYHGTETRLCLFEGENHGLVVNGRPLSKLRRYEELLGWFDHYLMKKRAEGGIA